MNPLIAHAQELIDLGIKAEKKEFYTLASVRYTMVWNTLFNLVLLRENKSITLSPQEEMVMSNLYHVIKARLRDIVPKMVDGYPAMAGKRHRDSPREAFNTILQEMEEFP